MRTKMLTRMMCFILSCMLVVSGVELPVYASAGDGSGREAVVQETDLPETVGGDAEPQTGEERTSTEMQAGDETASTQIPLELEEETSDSKSTGENTEENSEARTEETMTGASETGTVSEEVSEDGQTEEELTQEESTQESISAERSETELSTGDSAEYSAFVINPLYEGIIDREQLEAQIKSLQDNKGVSVQSEPETFQSIQAAADYVRSQMVERVVTITFKAPTTLVGSSDAEFSAFTGEVADGAIAHSEGCTGEEGDALAWVIGGYEVGGSFSGGVAEITYTYSYYTTKEQETELTKAVDSAMEELNLAGETEYQKIKKIHDYICNNVDYDYTESTDRLKHTAYAALCTGKAVCQGYAVLFYRMCKEAGLSVRVITGIGNGGAHAWNIVRMGTKYYNVDSTWDGQDTETRHTYFMLNEEDFVDHIREGVYASDAFYAQYPMADASYIDESGFSEGLNKDNLSMSFTTLDEQAVTSAAEEKPKMIVFFSTNCGNSKNTIKSIAGHSFSNVDILAVGMTITETNASGTKEAVTNFKNTYGGDNITFCYDKSDSNKQSMFQYIWAADLGNSASFPVVCYIDANNKFQHITQGFANASEIEANLGHYCSASQAKEYTITYVLNGGTNNSGNPPTYRSTSDTIILKDAVKTGWTFAGWYLDAAFTRKVTEIAHGNSGNITLYAKWEGKEPTDKLNLDNPVYSFNTIDGDEVDTTAAGRPKLLIFFSVNCGKSQQTIQSIRQGIPDVDIYAIDVIKSTKEAVTAFKNTYGSDNIVFCWDTFALNTGGQKKYINAANVEDPGPPMLCYIDINNKLQYITSGTSSADAIVANINAYCYGSSAPVEPEPPKTTYTVTFHVQNHGTAPSSCTVEEGGTIERPSDPTADGYAFEGWYKDPECTNAWNFATDKVTSDTTLYAKWTEKKPGQTKTYTVTFDVQNHGTAPSSCTVEEGGTIERPSDPTADGYAFEGWYKDPECTNAWNFATDKVTSDITLYAKWTEKKPGQTKTYTVTFDVQNHGTAPSSCTVEEGGTIVKPSDPTADGYTFEGWYKDPECTNAWNFATDKVTSDITLYAKWTEKKPGQTKTYTVTFDVQNHGTAPSSCTVEEGGTIERPSDPTADGYTFEGWYRESKCINAWNFNTDTVTADITLYAKWTKDKDDSPYQPDERIDLKTAASGAIANIKAKTYDGNPYEPTVRVTVMEGGKKKTLTEGIEYRVRYINNSDAGTGTVIVSGNGLYKGEITKEFEIKPKSIKKLKVVTGSMTVGDTSVPPVCVYDGARLLKKDAEYGLSYDNGLTAKKTNAAKVTITAAEGSNYTGSVTVKLAVYEGEASNIINPENVKLKYAETTYTGKAIKDNEPAVKIGDKALVKNKDYKVQFQNNTNAGTAFVIVTGKGAYKGKVVTPFVIKPAKGIELSAKPISDKTYNGKLQKPAVAGVKAGNKKLVKNRDYTVSYSDNLHAGEKKAGS